MIPGHSCLGNSIAQIAAITSAAALLAYRSLVMRVYNNISLIYFFCSVLNLSQILSATDIVSTLLIKVPAAYLRSDGLFSSIRI